MNTRYCAKTNSGVINPSDALIHVLNRCAQVLKPTTIGSPDGETSVDRPTITILLPLVQYARIIPASFIDYKNLTWGVLFDKLTLSQLRAISVASRNATIYLVSMGDDSPYHLFIRPPGKAPDIDPIPFPISSADAWKILTFQLSPEKKSKTFLRVSQGVYHRV